MRHHRRIPTLVLAVVVAVVAVPVLGNDSSSTDWSLRGGFQLGFRSIDVDGREEKYKEDFNLEDGPRLFHLDFDLAPPKELRHYFDHLEVNMNNVGGDPFESLRFTIEKFGRYSLKWEQRKSAYFYEDIILPPELSSPELITGGDHHTFDFDRIRDSASFTIWLSEDARFDLGFDRYTKKGHSTTTYDVQRDEFEVEQPIDESLNEYRAGLSYDWDRVTIIFREHVREYENSVEAFLPGASDGSIPDDPTVLDYFFLSQPYDLTSYGHSLAVTSRPNDRLLLGFTGILESFDLDMDVSEEASGVGFLGQPFATDVAGVAELDRDLALFGLDASFHLNDRVAFIVEAKSKSLDQEGTLDLDGEASETSYGIDTTGLETAVQIEPAGDLTLSAGVRSETREVETGDGDSAAAEGETEHSGYFATVGWHPGRRLALSARFDVSSFDNPLSAGSPSDRNILRLRARYAKPMGFSLTGAYHLDSLDNSDGEWQVEVEHFSLRAGYRFALLSLSLGYSIVDTDREVDRTVVTLPGFMGGLELFYPIAYRSDTEVIDARISWAVNPRVKIGGELRLYENEGSFPLEREQGHLFSEFGFGRGYVAHLGLRRVDYDEGRDDFDDYEADIVEVSLGYRWR